MTITDNAAPEKSIAIPATEKYADTVERINATKIVS
jgi:hypothetical protein